MNGLTNAAKYGGGGGVGPELLRRGAEPEPAPAPIRLSARLAPGGSGLEVEVLDSGPGLRGRSLAELTREFTELPNRREEDLPPGSPATLLTSDSAFNRVSDVWCLWNV